MKASPCGALTSLQQQHHQIHFADGTAGALHQPLPQQVVRFVDARGIHQNHLSPLRGENRPQSVAGGLGHRRSDRHLLPHQLIHQGGLAHIGATDQGDETGAVVLRLVVLQ